MMPALKISHYNGDMRGNEVVVYSALSRDACQQRIALADSRGSSEIVGHVLSSQIDVVDGGDRFELRHKFERAVFIGTVSPSDSGSVISGQIEVPAQHFYRLAIGFVTFIALLVLGTYVYDLAFGTHRLLTRSPTELGPGHPATLTQHFAIFLLVPDYHNSVAESPWGEPRGPPIPSRVCAKTIGSQGVWVEAGLLNSPSGLTRDSGRISASCRDSLPAARRGAYLWVAAGILAINSFWAAKTCISESTGTVPEERSATAPPIRTTGRSGFPGIHPT
jgi:hypothetical protein